MIHHCRWIMMSLFAVRTEKLDYGTCVALDLHWLVGRCVQMASQHLTCTSNVLSSQRTSFSSFVSVSLYIKCRGTPVPPPSRLLVTDTKQPSCTLLTPYHLINPPSFRALPSRPDTTVSPQHETLLSAHRLRASPSIHAR